MPKKILIIEDEQITTKSLQKLLKKQSYEVTVTSSGKDALEKVESEEFDLVVSDIKMPEMDGIETIKAIRKILDEKGKGPIPEILITGYADENKYQEAIELKVKDYIYKPFDISDFLEAVRRNLGA